MEAFKAAVIGLAPVGIVGRRVYACLIGSLALHSHRLHHIGLHEQDGMARRGFEGCHHKTLAACELRHGFHHLRLTLGLGKQRAAVMLGQTVEGVIGITC
jgi:hypothetical protein